MSLNKILFFTFLIIVGCQNKTELIYSTECVECMEYEFQQIYNENTITFFLETDTYCLGDSILSYPNSGDIQFLATLNEELIDLITQNGYCMFLLDSLIAE